MQNTAVCGGQHRGTWRKASSNSPCSHSRVCFAAEYDEPAGFLTHRNSGSANHLWREHDCKELCTPLDPIESKAVSISLSTRPARNLLLELILPLAWQYFIETK